MAPHITPKPDWTRTATYEDANLLLRLYEERREEKLRKARAWFVAECKPKTYEEFEALCPVGSEPNAYFRMVVTYWEMAATFVVMGVLHPAMFMQNSLEHLIVWERAQGVIAEMRKRNNAPHQAKNLEIVAGWAAEYLNHQGDGVYESFVSRFKA